MTFKMTFVVACEWMRIIFHRNFLAIPKLFKHDFQLVKFVGFMLVALKVFFELPGKFQRFHSESTKLLKLSRSSVSRFSLRSASGHSSKSHFVRFFRNKRHKNVSTRLLSERLRFTASSRSVSINASLSRNDV